MPKPKYGKSGIRDMRRWGRYFIKTVTQADVTRLARKGHHEENSPFRQIEMQRFLEKMEQGLAALKVSRKAGAKLLADTALKTTSAKTLVSASKYGRLARAVEKAANTYFLSRRAKTKKQEEQTNRLLSSQVDEIIKISGKEMGLKIVQRLRELTRIIEEAEWE